MIHQLSLTRSGRQGKVLKKKYSRTDVEETKSEIDIIVINKQPLNGNFISMMSRSVVRLCYFKVQIVRPLRMITSVLNIKMNAACTFGDQCRDANAECYQGTCKCKQEFFMKSARCGMYAIFCQRDFPPKWCKCVSICNACSFFRMDFSLRLACNVDNYSLFKQKGH